MKPTNFIKKNKHGKFFFQGILPSPFRKTYLKKSNFGATSKYIWLLFALSILASCSPGEPNEKAPPALSPTSVFSTTSTPTPFITASPTVTTQSPTFTPSPTLTPQPVFTLSRTKYQHSENIFSFTPPEGWEAVESNLDTIFASPEKKDELIVTTYFTGYPLGEDALQSFINGREATLFSQNREYIEIFREDKTDLSKPVVKTLISDNTAFSVLSFYFPEGSVIFTIDFWVAGEISVESRLRIQEIVDTFTSSEVVIGELNAIAYQQEYTFLNSDFFFQTEIPVPWRYEKTQNSLATIETFYAPDEHATIQIVIYDDEQPLSDQAAGEFALILMREFYASDIFVSQYVSLDDGKEQLFWESPAGEYRGITFFETLDTRFILFSVIWDIEYEETYLPSLENSLSSFEEVIE